MFYIYSFGVTKTYLNDAEQNCTVIDPAGVQIDSETGGEFVSGFVNVDDDYTQSFQWSVVGEDCSITSGETMVVDTSLPMPNACNFDDDSCLHNYPTHNITITFTGDTDDTDTDDTGPTISNPSVLTTGVVGANVQITWTITDISGVDINSIVALIGTFGQSGTITQSGNQYTFSGTLPNTAGTYQYRVSASDNEGNNSIGGNVNVIVQDEQIVIDNDAPQIINSVNNSPRNVNQQLTI